MVKIRLTQPPSGRSGGLRVIPAGWLSVDRIRASRGRRFPFGFFHVGLAFDDLEKAKAAEANVSIGICVKLRFSLRH
jgi:hypothetical protein